MIFRKLDEFDANSGRTLPGMGRPRTTRTSDQVTIRLPDGLRDRINKLAARNGRSANSEIVAFIEQGMKKPTEAEERLARIEAKLDELLNRMNGK
ncbi:Arc family DNA-binding protein [Parapusillimonas sp. JC17]|uniref:Arc family DNA-binding protein n=1 Tax=Parapusillimonas sp. JC17 TaxID=3445768 RepID=UPI003F9F0ACD